VVHFIVLPSLVGTVAGSAIWFLIGWLFDRAARLWRRA
jgi:membrane protein DedA with SNARE-associated domain